jgi:hypothetical protein
MSGLSIPPNAAAPDCHAHERVPRNHPETFEVIDMSNDWWIDMTAADEADPHSGRAASLRS